VKTEIDRCSEPDNFEHLPERENQTTTLAKTKTKSASLNRKKLFKMSFEHQFKQENL
jgi:hypothetical protein